MRNGINPLRATGEESVYVKTLLSVSSFVRHVFDRIQPLMQ